MAKVAELISKLCSQIMKYLLSKSASKIDISCQKEKDQRYLIEIQAQVDFNESDLDMLKFYLNVEKHEELAYYYLPLVGEYGSEEEMLLISSFLDSVSVVYNKELKVLNLRMLVKI
ncbi:hypothetical protein [Pseudothermotoga thermarum]|uniref:Uncharacterized protein n=1 Tax=Pseudothermotoga thermarum DSM 5069 TaxID=688269 RepID=F7YWG4_9THEM|nr:hypothetical protein [Pseudothermotoga thermarum]AEH51943.1 hypothetical protein Theth_1902 [Pseudothermotoga thermarum DSM 5069]